MRWLIVLDTNTDTLRHYKSSYSNYLRLQMEYDGIRFTPESWIMVF